MKKLTSILLALCLTLALATPAFATKFIDAHGNEIELDDTLEAYAEATLFGADDAARKRETNLGDLWTDALRWFAVSGRINEYFEEDDVTAGNNAVAVDADTSSPCGTAAICARTSPSASSARRSWPRCCPIPTRSPSST